jgi:hypothetical protein
MYIDKTGEVYNNIALQMEETKEYLPGWYYIDETGCYGNDDPFETIEEAISALHHYVKYNLNGGI